MKFLDFFAGIGGFHAAFNRVGWDCLGFCEIDKFARQSYKAIHNTEGMEEWHDITRVSDDDFRRLRGRVDIIAGGFPCQAFSVAGKRGGFEDTRGTLFFEVARAAQQIQPRYLLLENVKGLLNHDKGNTFGTILNTLHELGYAHIEWGVFNTKYWGVPQNRERVFILAELRDDPTEPYLLPLLQQQHKNGVTARLRDVLETDADEKYYLSEEKTAKLIETLEDRVKVKEATKQGYAEAFPGDAVNMAQPNSKTRRGRVGRELANTLLTGQEQAVLEPHIKMAGYINPEGFRQTNEVLDTEGISTCLRTFQGGGLQPKIAEPSVNCVNVWKEDGTQTRMQDRVYDADGVSVALTSFSDRLNVILPKYRVRKLTPLECWRLQDFTDEQFYKSKADGVSDSQLYKQAGNSVTVKVVEMIARQIQTRIEGEAYEGESNKRQSLPKVSRD